MSSAGVGPLRFLKTNVTAPVYQEILEHFMLPSADQLFKDADFIFQQDLAKITKSLLNVHGVGVLDWPANSPDLNIENIWVLSRGKWETRDQKMQMSWRPLSKKPSQVTYVTMVPRVGNETLRPLGVATGNASAWLVSEDTYLKTPPVGRRQPMTSLPACHNISAAGSIHHQLLRLKLASEAWPKA